MIFLFHYNHNFRSLWDPGIHQFRRSWYTVHIVSLFVARFAILWLNDSLVFNDFRVRYRRNLAQSLFALLIKTARPANVHFGDELRNIKPHILVSHFPLKNGFLISWQYINSNLFIRLWVLNIFISWLKRRISIASLHCLLFKRFLKIIKMSLLVNIPNPLMIFFISLITGFYSWNF